MPFKKVNSDLLCDELHCNRAYLARDTWEQTLYGARVSGWGVYSGTLNSGDEVFWAMCPNHVKTQVPPASGVLEGQLSLFDDQD